MPVSLNHAPGLSGDGELPEEVMWDSEIDYMPVMRLDTDRGEAMKKMAQIQKISETLCDLDCGSCGAPTCRALAEDIVRGEASIDDCVIKLRQKLQSLEEN